jgi:hypothetical protein
MGLDVGVNGRIRRLQTCPMFASRNWAGRSRADDRSSTMSVTSFARARFFGQIYLTTDATDTVGLTKYSIAPTDAS